MPGAYFIDTDRRIVLTRAWGVLTAQELIGHARALVADPRFDPTYRQLGDLRDVVDLQVDAATIRVMATLSPFGPGARRALVVGSDVAYGMARMFQIMRSDSGDDLSIFRRLHDALVWLDLAADEAAITTLLHAAPPTPAA